MIKDDQIEEFCFLRAISDEMHRYRLAHPTIDKKTIIRALENLIKLVKACDRIPDPDQEKRPDGS